MRIKLIILLAWPVFGLTSFAADAPKTETSTPIATPAEVESTRAAFLKLINRPKVPPEVEIRDLGDVNGVHSTHFTYLTETGKRVPGLTAEPAAGTERLPVVIMLHGTGGKKEDMKDQMEIFARSGFLAVAIDGPYHGERAASGGGSDDYQAAILQAWRDGKEHPFFYDTVWDVMRLVDYLQTRDDVDPKRIGLMGVSKGGIETYLTAAVDPRIAAALPFIGLESFRYALDHELWQPRVDTFQKAIDQAAKDSGVAKIDAAFVRKFYDKVAPGIYGQFDGPAMAPLIAPRPLLAINGEIDPRTPQPGIQECLAAARPLYVAAKAEDHLQLYLEPNTPHKVTPEAYVKALAWFQQWLQPEAK